MELEVDVWVEMHLKMYYKSYIPFVCEQFEKFFIFSINFIVKYNFWSIEIYGILGVRSKGIWMSEKSYGFDNIWS